MKIFITGASGFVGGALAQHLAQSPEKYEVYAMARSSKSAEKVKAVGAIPVTCELNAVDPSHLAGMDVIVHSAAFVEPWGSRKDFWTTNVDGTQQLLDAAAKAGVKRFIHIGTEAALFHGQPMVQIDETYPLVTKSPFLYSETKAEAERRVVAANGKSGMETVVIRPRLIWGPGDVTVLPNLVEMVDKGAFRWVDQGKHLTSTTHIANLIHGIELAFEKGRGGQVYFVTDGENKTMKQFLTGYLGTAGRKPKDSSVPGWFLRTVATTMEFWWKVFGIKKKPPLPRFSASIMSVECTIRDEKAQHELGYSPVIGVDEGFAQLRA